MATLGKRVLVGRALASSKAEHQLLPKFLALPVFSSDPLSSVAYATEEMMLVLVLAGASALRFKLPLALGIAILLAIVITSYRQTVRAYPMGGGSYIVARENLGTLPGLIAAAAILTDYVLTVAVSITAGTIAVTSAIVSLRDHRVLIAIALVILVTLANLRGVKEAGTLFALPTYGFVAMVGITLASGFFQCLSGCPVAESANLPIVGLTSISLFLLARAFSSGATALTGVEAIADGVGAFRRPQSKNAAATLAIMGVMSITMFLGITVLSSLLHVRTDEKLSQSISVLAQIGETVFGRGLMFGLLQIFTAGILILAANTAFQDFPRLSSILARDRFMPSQFGNRGNRLVFSNGVVVLAGFASLLIWLFDAELTRLIQLYVVGVFTAFTLSQAGMVRRWIKRKTEEAHWRRSALINGVGAATTGIVLVIVTTTKFAHGAWIVIVAIPIIVMLFLSVHRHYERTARSMGASTLPELAEMDTVTVPLVSDLGPATMDAVAYLRGTRPDDVRPLYIGPPERFEEVAAGWSERAPRLGSLEPTQRSHEHLVGSIKKVIRSIGPGPERLVNVVIAESVGRRSLWRQVLGSTFRLKASLLFEDGVVVTDVPLVPEDVEGAVARAGHPTEAEHNVVLVPVGAVHDGTVRAVAFAKSLNPTFIQAMYLLTDPGTGTAVVDAWHERGFDIPLVLVEAPFRDVGVPMLEEVRAHTRHGDSVVTVVLPELIPRHWWENALHNQTALYLKRLLLFEPDVVVASVPFHLKSTGEVE